MYGARSIADGERYRIDQIDLRRYKSGEHISKSFQEEKQWDF